MLLHQLLRFVVYLVELCLSLDVIGQRGAVGSDIERARSTFDYRQTAVAAHREAAADGDIELTQVSYQHLFDTAELEVVLNGVERSENNTFHPFEVELMLL